MAEQAVHDEDVVGWLEALEDVVAALATGARVADVGCRDGAFTIALARAFPRSTFAGFDEQDGSIAAARKAGAEAGVSDRVTFEVASARDYPGNGFDLICFFAGLHDVAAAQHAREALALGGAVVVGRPHVRRLLADAGFTRVEPAVESAYGQVFTARP